MTNLEHVVVRLAGQHALHLGRVRKAQRRLGRRNLRRRRGHRLRKRLRQHSAVQGSAMWSKTAWVPQLYREAAIVSKHQRPVQTLRPPAQHPQLLHTHLLKAGLQPLLALLLLPALLCRLCSLAGRRRRRQLRLLGRYLLPQHLQLRLLR